MINSSQLLTINVATQQRCQMVDITVQLQGQVQRQQVVQGILWVHCPHTTAGLTINENADPDVQRDMLAKLAALVPQRESYYRHGEGNSDAHVKTTLTGNGLTLLIEQGKLVLGQWQGVYLCEYDGPRSRQVMVKILDLHAQIL